MPAVSMVWPSAMTINVAVACSMSIFLASLYLSTSVKSRKPPARRRITPAVPKYVNAYLATRLMPRCMVAIGIIMRF